MLSIARQTLDFYGKYLKTPTLNDIEIKDINHIETKGSLFVTLYKNGEIRGSAGNIKEIKNSIATEIIENTIAAASGDNRFSALQLSEISSTKIRIDEISNRRIIQNGEILKIDPVKNGVLAIKRDYEKMAVILPNIHPSLLTGDDFLPILQKKLGIEKFDDSDYIIYELETTVHRDF